MSSERITVAKLINISSLHIVTLLCMYVMSEPEISLPKFPIFNTALLTIAIMLYLRSLDLLNPHNCYFVPFDQYLPPN